MWTTRREGESTSDQIMTVHEYMATKSRSLFLYGIVLGVPDRVDQFNVHSLGDQMMAMSKQDPDTPIKLFIDSPGGSVKDGFRLIDIMTSIPAPVWTVGSDCQSMAALILAAGEPGHRYVFPHAQSMLHLAQGTASGDSKEMAILQEEMAKTINSMVEFLQGIGVKHKKTKILKDIDRAFYLNAKETIDYGLADKLVDKKFFKEL